MIITLSSTLVEQKISIANVDEYVQGCIQKFPHWLHGVRTANCTALCHKVQLCHYFVSQSSEFCCHNPLCCFSTNVGCCCCC